MKRAIITTIRVMVLVVSTTVISADFVQAQTLYAAADGYMRDNPIDGVVDAGPYGSLLAQYAPDYDEGEGLEDRGFVEFEIVSLSGTLLAELQLTEWHPSFYADETVSIYGYFGANADGSINPSDWNAGILVGQITTTGTIGIHHTLDVSSVLNSAVAADADYLGFRVTDENPTTPANHFSCFVSSGEVGDTAYGELVGAGDQPMLHVVPEPATIALLGLGALSLLRKRKA